MSAVISAHSVPGAFVWLVSAPGVSTGSLWQVNFNRPKASGKDWINDQLAGVIL
jgi:hypothetical protein